MLTLVSRTKTRCARRWLWLLLGLVAAPLCAVADAAVEWQVTDQNGAPLPGAVVTVGDGVTPVATLETPAEMAQEKQQFSPQVIVVPVGTNVSIPNKDVTLHHVYSFSPAKVFELKLYRGVDHAPLLFDKAGVVELGCNIHDAMRGYIVVTDDPLYGISDADGWVRFPNPPSGFRAAESVVTVWHPRQTAVTATAPITSGETIALSVRPPPKPVRRGLKSWSAGQ